MLQMYDIILALPKVTQTQIMKFSSKKLSRKNKRIEDFLPIVNIEFLKILKGAPRSKIRGQLFGGFWQFLSDLDETWCGGPF